ncbi:hypothetical protein EV426DRAFT_673664 [Tirmania nivea]|nr:hypothetical protein EV426DRAFT_673664 [Tirmania nivea]
MTRLGFTVPGGVRVLHSTSDRSRYRDDTYFEQSAHDLRSVRCSPIPGRRPSPPLEDTIIVATETSATPISIPHTLINTTGRHSSIAESIPNPVSESSKSVSKASTLGYGLKQSPTNPRPKPSGDSIKAGLPGENTVQALVVRNRKQGVATPTPSRPTRARRLPYWFEKENREPVPSNSSRPQVEGINSVSSHENTPGIWDTKQETPRTKQKSGLGKATAQLRILQQIENLKSQAQAKPGSSVAENIEVTAKQCVERTPYDRFSSPGPQQFQPRLETGQLSLQIATLKPTEKLDVIQESIKVAPAMPEPSPSAVGGNALPPESTLQDTPKNHLARRLRKRRNSEITTYIADSIQSPPRQPSVETTIAPVRITRAFASGTRPPLNDGPYARKYTRKTEIVTESTLPKFSMPTSTFDPDTIVLKYTGQAKVGMQSSKSTGDKRQTDGLSSNAEANAEVSPSGPQEKASRGRARKHVSNSSVEEEHESVIQTENKRGNARPRAGLDGKTSPTPVERLTELSEGSPQASSTEEVLSSLIPATKRDTSGPCKDERWPSGRRAQVSLDLEPFTEVFQEPYASTFFTPHLHDYNLPSSIRAPPLYYHTELPSHPPVPERSLSTPVSVMTAILGLHMQSTICTPAKPENAEISELLEPMTDTEDEGDDDTILATESDGDSGNASNSIVRFPWNATEETAAEYAKLKRALEAGLEQQKEVQEKVDASQKNRKRMLKAQEAFEKKEQWKQRRPAKRAGTRSSSGMMADGPGFLEYLREKAKEDQ